MPYRPHQDTPQVKPIEGLEKMTPRGPKPLPGRTEPPTHLREPAMQKEKGALRSATLWAAAIAVIAWAMLHLFGIEIDLGFAADYMADGSLGLLEIVQVLAAIAVAVTRSKADSILKGLFKKKQPSQTPQKVH